jgi:hypothetical protein
LFRVGPNWGLAKLLLLGCGRETPHIAFSDRTVRHHRVDAPINRLFPRQGRKSKDIAVNFEHIRQMIF